MNDEPHKSGYIKPSIQAALDNPLDETHPTGHHRPSVASSHMKPEDRERTLFDPGDFDPLHHGEIPPGFGVIMPDAATCGGGFNHISSSNEGVITVTNTSAEFFDFGVAIRSMECGLRVQRAGWNGKGMWIAISGLEGPREVQAVDLWSYQAKKHAISQGGSAKVLPCIIQKMANGDIMMGWLAAQCDILAKDWRIVD